MVVLKILDKVFKHISNIISSISGCILFVAVALFGLNTVLRFAFKTSLIWADEFALIFYIIGLFLLFVQLDYDDTALSIGFIYDKMKKKSIGKLVMDIIRWVATVLIGVILINSGYYAIKRAITYNALTLTAKIPIKYTYGLMVLGVVIWLIYWILSPFIKASRKGDEEK